MFRTGHTWPWILRLAALHPTELSRDAIDAVPGCSEAGARCFSDCRHDQEPGCAVRGRWRGAAGRASRELYRELTGTLER